MSPTGKKADETKSADFKQILKETKEFDQAREIAPGVELVGRIRKGDDPNKFILLMPNVGGSETPVEIKVDDVLTHKQVFEDSSGERTYSIRILPGAQIKLILEAAALGAPTTARAKIAEPKQFDPKISDPKFDPKTFDPKISDPKYFDPKTSDPKFDPKQFDPKVRDPKQFDPKTTDPKQFDPKTSDPKHFDPKISDLQI